MPVVRRTVIILFSLSVLFLFGYPRFAINNLTFSYTSYQRELDRQKFEISFYSPAADGGLANATAPADVEKLEQQLNEFEVYYTTGYLRDDAHALNDYAWNAFQYSESELILEEALKWSDRSIAIEPDWMFLDTKANLLFKLKRFDEALPVAKEAYAAGQDDATGKLVDDIQIQLGQKQQ